MEIKGAATTTVAAAAQPLQPTCKQQQLKWQHWQPKLHLQQRRSLL